MIWQDHLFTDASTYRVDYLAPNKSITPFAGPPDRGLSFLLKSGLFAFRLITRQYQLLVIPGIDFDWPWDSTPLKARVRKMLRCTLAWRFGSAGKSLLRHCLPKGGRLVVLDRYDSSQLLTSCLTAVGADFCFKTNLEVKDQDLILQGVTHLHPLPYELITTSYPPPHEQKEVDVLFALSMNSDIRQRALDELSPLMDEGVKILRPVTPLGGEAYLSALSRSHLCISPEGLGYHCFRHYEAMLCGSIPVINRALNPVVTDLEHGKNCLMYDSECPGDLARVVIEALRDKTKLQSWGKQLRQHALNLHSLSAVGNQVLQKVQTLASSSPS